MPSSNRLIELQMEGSVGDDDPQHYCRTMNKAHSHGGGSEKAHPSRADRPGLFRLNDVPVPARTKDWHFTPSSHRRASV